MENPETQYTTGELAKALSLDLSTIQRSVKKLREKEVLARRQSNLEGGGYEFRYELCNKKKVVRIITSIIENWTNKVKEELGKIS